MEGSHSSSSTASYHKLAAFDGLELLAAKRYTQPFPWHAHDTYSLSLITGGTESIQLPTTTLYAPAGSLSITHPQEVHANPVLHVPGHSFYTFYISPEVLTRLANGLPVYFREQIIHNSLLFARFWQLAQQVSQPDPAFEERLAEALRELVGRYATPEPTCPDPADAQRIRLLKAQLGAQLYAPVSLEELARQHGLNKFQLLRYFKQHTGLTPHGYVLMQRVEAAKHLLRQGQPLVETALAVGFYDQAHFSRFFKSFVGVSPGRYQRIVQAPGPGF